MAQMTRSQRTRAMVVVLAAGLLGLSPTTRAQEPGADRESQTPAALAWARASESFGGVKAETRPKLDSTMQFSFATEVREILARGGQRVKKGELLVRARDAEIIGALEQQRLLASSDLEVQGAETALKLAQFKLAQAQASKTFSPSEYEELETAAETARIQRDLAKVNLQRQQSALKQIEGQAERYRLEAPFDGIIEELMIEVGQGVNEQAKVLRIVNTDRLILDAYAPTDETLRLKLEKGSRAWVLLDVSDAPAVVQGVVDYVSPVADSVSQTRRVRVEIENPTGWPAGVQAKVRFTPAPSPTAQNQAGGASPLQSAVKSNP